MRQDPPRSFRPGRAPRAFALTCVLVAAGLLTSLAGPALAQDDGTGASPLPPPTDCVLTPARADVVPTGEASPVVAPAATPQASPIADTVATPQASPIADPGAPPLASPVAEERPSDILVEVQHIATSIVACLNEGNYAAYAQLTSDDLRGQLFGSTEPLPADQFVALAATLPGSNLRLVEVGNLQVIDGDTITVDTVYVSDWQLRASTWTFVRARVDGLVTWLLDHEAAQPVVPPDDASVIDIDFADDAYTLSTSTVRGPDVILGLDNPTGADHEALVVRIEGNATAADLLRSGGDFPEGITFIGQATVLAGGSGTLVLVDLPIGTYTIVDMLPDENGLPHLSSGMAATFTVTGPAGQSG